MLTLTAFGVSLLVQHTVVPNLSWNRDEPVYLWHVDVLRAGQLSTTDGGHPDLFQPWLSAARAGTLFSQYTLGWPLVLLAGAMLGSTDLAVATGTAMAVAGTWAFIFELTRDRALASVAGLFMLVSPILLVQSGSLLNYLFTLGLGLLFLTLVRVGVRTGSRLRMVGSGLLLGWIFFTRPYDAAVWGLLAMVPLLIEHRAQLRRLGRPALWGTVGLVPLVALTLALNQRLTGSALEFPITVADPLDQFGFGRRRLMPGFGIIAYGPRLAVESTARNVFWLPFFLVGAHLGGIVAAAGAWVNRRQSAVPLLLALGLAFPIAYFAFFGTHISSLTARLSGPIYYVPAYVPLCALMAMAVVHLGRRRPSLGLGLGCALILLSVPATISRLSVNHDLSEANRPWARSLEGVEGRSLVVPSPQGYLLFINPFGDNGADLDGRILFAGDNGPELLDLVQEHPDRTPYLQRADLSVVDLLPSENPRTPRVQLTPMEVLRGDVHLVGTVSPVEGAEATAWWVEVDGSVLVDPSPVTSRTSVDLDLGDVDLPEGLHTLELRLGSGIDAGDAARSPLRRRTFYVRISDGEVELLAPGTAARQVRRDDAAEAVWEDALSLPELRVDPLVPPSP